MNALNVGGAPAGLELQFESPAAEWSTFDWLAVLGMAQQEVGTAAVTEAGAIASIEAFGVPTLSVGVAVSSAGAIASAEAVNVPGLALGDDVQDAGGIFSGEAVGTPSLSVGVEGSDAGAVVSAEAFGMATMSSPAEQQDLVFAAAPLPRRSRVPSKAPVARVGEAGGIPSEESVGSPVVWGELARVRRVPATSAPVAVVVEARARIEGAGGIASVENFGRAGMWGMKIRSRQAREEEYLLRRAA